jgi:small multidrug resistance family-3 protein
MRSLFWYLWAALGEIGGCFSFWAWQRMHKSPLWTIPGVIALILFALALTRISHKGRATPSVVTAKPLAEKDLHVRQQATRH